MNKKLVSIISAMALTTSTATALTSNAIAQNSKNFIWEDFAKVEVSENMLYAYNDVYIDSLENDRDGYAQMYIVQFETGSITLTIPETVDIEKVKEKVCAINDKVEFAEIGTNNLNITTYDENGNRTGFEIADIKAIYELYKGEDYIFNYQSPHYSYSTAYCTTYGLLAYTIDLREQLESYIAENKLDLEIVEPEKTGEYGDGAIIQLVPKKEMTDVEYFQLAQKIYVETGLPFHCLQPHSGETTPNFTIDNSYLNGDANKDEKLTLADSVAVLQSIANPDKYALSMEGEFNAEVDGEDGITVNDALIIRQWGLDNTKGN